jgi:hypothetical protein
MSKAERDIERKLRVLRHAEMRGSVAKTCRHLGLTYQDCDHLLGVRGNTRWKRGK